ncbi:MAG TPA: autotransporter outer membrane beta-barrel domain-containing protein [Candidatus Caccocola faecipullorum]|nr:autotransporter outer membrane beta-barrel domain-containing protein [Candidatus Caccocola faecipullorum]
MSAESGGTVEFISVGCNTVTSTAQRTTSASGEEITFTNALYADGENSSVEITAGNGAVNEIKTDTEGADENSKERTVWAANGGRVKLTGVTSITAGLTDFDGASDNSAMIAIAAGNDDWNTQTGNSLVNLMYGDNTGERSFIKGDVVAGKNGIVSIVRANEAAYSSAMNFTGNALAANGGELSLELGDGGVWYGRADDYKDAENEAWREAHTNIFAPQFSNGIQSNGSVNVNLGSGYWDVTGQSWVTKLEGSGIIDLRGSEKAGGETGGYAIHIGELTGNNTFYLNLYNGDKIGDGDMIYIAKGVTAPQKIVIANRDEVLSSMNAGDRIRFATIGGDVDFSESSAPAASAAAFGRRTKISDAGMMNVNFSIDYLDYKDTANDGENDEAYHGEEMTENKPGADYVESIYGPKENSQNVYVTRLKSEELSDAGRTVLNMSRANYAAAVYMDRLNKRMGEARYFAGQDEGIWARVRHDRVGRDDAFLVQNTMFEVGYDRKIASKTGTRRVGIAADYMEGDTEYNNIAGEGEIDRFGLWFYSTWFGEKGHYTDYVLKWGRMSNEFDIYGMTTGERITGDYDNNVFSASAEYGRKIELGKGWFFEPQAQVQFARITDADYVTSQGTRVEVDGINSLIARAGFRLGREFGGESQGSVYVKADVLHEFLGDQDVHALDGTTDNRWYTVGYDNDGTWYDVGLGLSCRTGKNSFVFLDLEHSFGNDNDDSYQISAGVQWSF